MPNKRKSACKRKRTYKRKSTINRPILSGFPVKKMVKLRYVDTGVNLDAPGGGIAQTVYRANSILDPYQPTGGHQPMGMDQWSVIYNKYTVLGAKITMEWSPLTAANIVPGRYGVLLSSDTAGTSDFTSINNLMESKLVGRNIRTFGVVYNANDVKKNSITKTFSAKKFFGKVNVVDGSANTGETGDGILTGTNPGNEVFFIPWAAAMASGQDPGVATFTIIIDYIVMFSDPRTLDGS